MEVDTRRKLIIVALDLRTTTGTRRRQAAASASASPCVTRTARAGSTPSLCGSGRHAASRRLREPARGPTWSCIQELQVHLDRRAAGARIRTGSGRSSSLRWPPTTLQNRLSAMAARYGSLTCATRRTRSSDEPVDLWRNDGYTDYSHDVDEDERDRVGGGPRRSVATPRGQAPRPVPESRTAGHAFDPILVAGGGLQWDVPPARAGDDGVAQATDFMHNSGRPTDRSVRASGVKTGNVLIGTEEDFTTPWSRAAGSWRSTSPTPGAASRPRTRPGRGRTG